MSVDASALLPMMTKLALGAACVALALTLPRITSRPASPELTRARAALTVFLLGVASLCGLDAFALGDSSSTLAGGLRVLTAAAGVAAAFLFSGARAVQRMRPAVIVAAAAEAPSPAAPAPASKPRPIATAEPAAEPNGSSREDVFLGLVSHELRTPLTAMQLLIDRLHDDDTALAPRHRKIVERLSTAAIRLTDLVDSVLYYARIRSGRLVTSVERFDLGTLATDAAEELRPLAERKSLDFAAEVPREGVSIDSDPKLLRLVILNLVSNAVKFTEHGKIAVSVSTSGDNRIVRVTDSGTGIAEAEQQRIFEPFQSVESTKHKHVPGIGLGLSLARQIVDNLGGQIAVSSELGRGSTFEVSLPAIARARTATASPP